MKNNRTFVALILAGLAFGACSGNKKSTDHVDSTAAADSAVKDTTRVGAADSTHSFRNDRGTDSVSAGKSVPAKP
ncbi:hypothetical protein [Pedobacter sp. L105]|uniref:hypothetical protein n=1 Tax=Pedobacter sp. L105 TaxID=1641871 RepID=UPI00131C4DFE|nr:hypothetical protein [Pedobacter sp. L105]